VALNQQQTTLGLDAPSLTPVKIDHAQGSKRPVSWSGLTNR